METDWSDSSTAEKCWQPAETGRGTEEVPLQSLWRVHGAACILVLAQWCWSQPSGLQNCETMQPCCSKLPGLWWFVIAASRNEYTKFGTSWQFSMGLITKSQWEAPLNLEPQNTKTEGLVWGGTNHSPYENWGSVGTCFPGSRTLNLDDENLDVHFRWASDTQDEVKWSEVKSLSRVRLFATPWTVAYQAPQSVEFSMQEYWSGLPFPSPGDLPNPGIKPGSPALQADTLLSEPPGGPR